MIKIRSGKIKYMKKQLSTEVDEVTRLEVSNIMDSFSVYRLEGQLRSEE